MPRSDNQILHPCENRVEKQPAASPTLIPTVRPVQDDRRGIPLDGKLLGDPASRTRLAPKKYGKQLFKSRLNPN